MTITPQMARRAASGLGMIDLGQYPVGYWRKRRQALEWRDRLSAQQRPYSPRSFTVEWGDRRVPTCFGRTGYGDGMCGSGTCSRWQCPEADDCYQAMKAIVEATDSRIGEFNIAFERERQVAVDRGAPLSLAGQEAMVRLQTAGAVRPFEQAVLANEELGRIDTGLWQRCSDCDRVAMIEVMREGRCPRCAEGRE